MKVRMTVEPENLERFIEKVMVKYHFSVEEKEDLMAVYETMKRYMTPYAIYRINDRMRGNALIDSSQCALVAMTLGEGLDRLLRYYEQEHAIEESYMAECLSNELLLQMYAEFNRCYPRFHRRFVNRYVFIGEEIPLTSIPDLLNELYGRSKTDEKKDGDIFANEYGVILPSKSVVFFAILSNNPNQVCQGICLNCGNSACENRMQDSKQIVSIGQNSQTQDETAATGVNLTYGYQRIFGKQ